MKKLFCLILLPLFMLSACTPNPSEEKAKNLIACYFEEKSVRSFEVSFPVKIEGQNCYKIVVNGILDNKRTYPIDTFAVNLNNDTRYFYDSKSNQYQKFYTTPLFACQTSPDGKWRMESVGMYIDGPSGLHALKEMRIINLSDGEVMWSGESDLSNQFMWSKDSRFVAAKFSGRQWTDTIVIDTKDFALLDIPGTDEIITALPDTSNPNIYVPMSLFKPAKWVNPTILLIDFEWATNNGTIVTGQYAYDLLKKEMDIKKITEITRG